MSTWSSPVRYGECDQQGVVFNAHYLAWADEAVTALFLDLGTPYAGLLARGLETAVVASELTWTSPARWGDLVGPGRGGGAGGRRISLRDRADRLRDAASG